MNTDAVHRSIDDWLVSICDHIETHDPSALDIAQKATEQHPTDPDLLSMAALTAVMFEKPAVCLRYLHRLRKRFIPNLRDEVVRAIAIAQQGNWAAAQSLLNRKEINASYGRHLFPSESGSKRGADWIRQILRWTPADHQNYMSAKRTVKTTKASHKIRKTSPEPVSTPDLDIQPLAVPAAHIPVTFTMPDCGQYSFLEKNTASTFEGFQLRMDCARLSLLKGFDDLLCLDQQAGVDHYWYQVETVRKVLKQFRGRVMLADEVGLGKTIEAGMVLKEYLLRGMVERVLILTPASLVGQWQEEMERKFGISFNTTHDSLLHRDSGAFWNQPRIIASIAAARRPPHYEFVTSRHFDMVIVDEAHHLKNRSTKNWQLVDALQKRFLLLLSATPVQNSLIELYNLLTLLKPGIFKTEKEFRTLFMVSGKSRLPANREKLQDLMRDAMIRNTRSLVDVRLPPRQAITIRVDPSPGEQECYAELNRMIRKLRLEDSVHHLAVHHLLETAGSSPAACSVALKRFMLSHAESTTGQLPTLTAEWEALRARYDGLGDGAKAGTLLSLLAKNPGEKKMIFVRFRETMNRLDDLLRAKNMSFTRFDGHMTGPEKDNAVEIFRAQADILLCSESGGEGRNLQFCNTLINFDLPWNPQIIEQRIGRIHRIGQKREVFIFNLAARHSVEDRILNILDEKINMFELVVGEVQSIMGEMEEEHDFSHMVFKAWIEETEEARERAFTEIGEKLIDARKKYEEVKSYDDALFGEEFEVV